MTDEGKDMGHPRTAVRGLATLTGLLLVAGCMPPFVGGDDDPAPPSTPVGAGTLTEDQLEQALPGEDDLPEGFSVDPESSDDGPDDEASAYPASCLDVRLAGTSGKELKTHLQAKATQAFIGEQGGSLTVAISTHDTSVPDQLFDDAGAAQSQCGTFELIDKTGTSSWKLDRVAFPQIGDRTYSTRVQSTTDGDIFKGGVVQIAGASRGTNLVYVVYASGPASKYDPEAVEKVTRATIDNLDAL